MLEKYLGSISSANGIAPLQRDTVVPLMTPFPEGRRTEVVRVPMVQKVRGRVTIMLPLMLPGVLAGALLAFTLSMDDFVVTFFTAGPGQPTLPLQIYSMIRIAVTPEVNAISSILMMLTLAVSLTAYRVSRDVWRAQL